MENELTCDQSAEIDGREKKENTNLIPLKVRDKRDPSQSDFDLNGFVSDLEAMRIMFITDKSLLRIGDRIRKIFQKYAGVGFSESDHFLMALEQAQAIEVLATSGKKFWQAGRTIIDVNIITGENEGYHFTFEYDKSGQYYNANWNQVNLKNAISGPDTPEQQSLPDKEQ